MTLLRVAPVLLVASLGASSGAVLVRLAEAPATVTAFWRLAFSVILVGAPFLVGRAWKEYRGLSATDLAWTGVAGVCLSLHFVSWFRSLELTSVASSTVLVSLHPLHVGLLSAWLLRERPATADWIGIVLALIGTCLVAFGGTGGQDSLSGNGLALLAGFLAAVYFIAGRRVRARLGLWAYVTPVYAIAAACTGLIAIAGADPLFGYPATTWIVFLGLAVGPSLIGHTGFNWALKHVPAYVVSLIQLFEPIGATLLAMLILGGQETPGIRVIVGGVTIIAGVWIPIRYRLRNAASTES